MAIDVYLQIDGINGESADGKHRDWFEFKHENASFDHVTAGVEPDDIFDEHIGLKFSKVKQNTRSKKYAGVPVTTRPEAGT